MIGLATRGYLCPGGRGGVFVVGPGPTITKTEAQSPEISGAAPILSRGPTLSGAALQAPVINPSPVVSGPGVAPGATPTIVGAGAQSPNINSGSEED